MPMVVGLIFAAAVSTAGAKPLFVPPKGMVSIAPDEGVRRELAYTKTGTFLREYQGFETIKPSWSNFTYKTPERIVIATRPTEVNAAEWGVRTLAVEAEAAQPSPVAVAYCRQHHCTLSRTRVKVIASQPLALCNGQRGWLNAFTRGENTYEQLFARSRNRLYVATLRYQTVPGDTFGAARALGTLCPPNAGELPAKITAVPFKPPAGWARSTSPGTDVPGFTPLASWYHQAPRSFLLQVMYLLSASDVSEYTTPEQMAQMWKQTMKQGDRPVRVLSDRAVKLCSGADGWLTSFQMQDRAGRPYAVENVYAYGKDTLYVLQYESSDTSGDPAAHEALLSLCPPRAAGAL